jgi:hypothetical protein
MTLDARASVWGSSVAKVQRAEAPFMPTGRSRERNRPGTGSARQAVSHNSIAVQPGCPHRAHEPRKAAERKPCCSSDVL